MTLQEASLNLTEQDYRQYPCLSYSNLQRYDIDGYDSIEIMFEPISSPSLLFGSLVDCLLTQGEDVFNSTYMVIDIPIPPESIINIVTQIKSEHTEKQFALITDADIISVADIYGYQKNWKDSTRATKIRELGSEYYNFIAVNSDKIFISKQDAEDAKKCVEAIKADSIVGNYFKEDCFTNAEHLYQLQFATIDKETGIQFKGMLDLVIVDHTNKKIYPCDLKTTKSIYTFEDSFYSYRYYLQAAIYTELLKNVIAEKCPELLDYTIENYRFIVISRKNFKPAIFQWNQFLDLTQYTDKYGRQLSNWKDLLSKVHWALNNKEVQLPKQWQESVSKDGFIPIKQYSKNV